MLYEVITMENKNDLENILKNMDLKFRNIDGKKLLLAISTDMDKNVLMTAFMSEESLEKSIETVFMHYYSTSRDKRNNFVQHTLYEVIRTPDTTPPVVKIISPTAKSYAEDAEISIKVQVTDDSEIYSVSAMLDDYTFELLESNGYYINILEDLEWGAHTLWIIATDAAGNSNYNEKVTFEINEGDITPPEVEISYNFV